jgi:prepilin-type N-terminal cleavage/methylation domain-containing protein
MRQAHAQHGFTLIELMISIAIAGFVLAAIFSAYIDQVRTSQTTDMVVSLNQNIRGAMITMERDVRMLGTNPTNAATTGVIIAEDSRFAMASDNGGNDNDAIDDGNDNDDDGLTDEGVNGADDDGDGWIDEADEAEWFDGDTNDQGEMVMYDLDSNNLRRRFNVAGKSGLTVIQSTATADTHIDHLARNVDVLNFVYLDDGDPPAPIATPVAGADLERIRAVQVTVVARAGDVLPPLSRPYTDKTVYANQQGDVLLDMSAAPDGFRRRLVTTTLKIRTRQ